MTALKPVESRDVRAVAAESYPSNRVCAVPGCSEPVQLRPDGTPTVHHAFPRGYIKSDSYFVSIDGGKPLPHAVGLCGSGTSGHHGDAEEHRAWIKLEDGVFNWYERGSSPSGDGWENFGPLNPQPGSVEGKPKRKRFQGEARKKRRTISLRVPDDQEDGAAELEEALTEFERKRGNGDKPRPWFYPILECVHYALLNSDESDF